MMWYSPPMLRPLPAALALMLWAPPAEAAFFEVGAYLSFTPGQRVPVGLGVEVTAGWIDLGSGPSLYDAFFLQAEVRGMSYLRTVLGNRAGVGYAQRGEPLVMPSLGIGLALRSHGGHGLHGDAGLQLGRDVGDRIGALSLRGDMTVPFKGEPKRPMPTAHALGPQEYSLTLGLSSGPAPYVATNWIEGRPLRVAGQPRLPAVLAARVPAGARSWLDRARTEHASVPAFDQLAAELAALGAPRRLVGRAQAAAAEERRHALLCYAQAQRLGARFAVGPAPGWHVRGGDRRQRLARISHEGLRDGIIGEGDAAARAAGRRDAARNEGVARIEHTIAVEEAGHARLAEDIVHWAARA